PQHAVTKPAASLAETQAEGPAEDDSEEAPRPPASRPAPTQPVQRTPTEQAAQTVASEPESDQPPTAHARPPAGGVQKTAVLGDYRLLKKLGQGGMGTVYRAHQISLDREVAIKVLSKELASKPAFVKRFLREARVMAKLDHPNILRCYEVKEAMGFHFLSME